MLQKNASLRENFRDSLKGSDCLSVLINPTGSAVDQAESMVGTGRSASSSSRGVLEGSLHV
jgi:hypothetical protein